MRVPKLDPTIRLIVGLFADKRDAHAGGAIGVIAAGMYSGSTSELAVLLDTIELAYPGVLIRGDQSMIRHLMSAFALAGILMATPTFAAPCKDAKGKFVKCPPVTVAKPGVVKDAKGKCHVASGPKKGQFTKC